MTNQMMRIGGGGGMMVDSVIAVPQLLAAGVDAIIMDFLAEGAMGLFGRMRAADPQRGFSSDFVDRFIGPHLDEIAAKGVRIVSNAGGVNPDALAAALRAEIAKRGLSIKVASISGDDLIDRADALVAAGTRDMANDTPLQTTGLTTINAYLGAFPIAEALRAGADIVVTGRVVDSALALGLLIDRFGWRADDWDMMAAGTLVGHLIECGPQVTGGTYTDWAEVEGWDNIGFPIAECFADGSCIITKADKTGGTVTFGTVAEQLLYETSDPMAYIVPDVVCDFSAVTITQESTDRVKVANARGRPRTPTLKACATWDEGWRVTVYQPVIGPRAVDKARKQADALFARGSHLLRQRNMTPFLATETTMIGAGESVGARAPDPASVREVLMKLSADVDEPAAAGLFAYELSTQLLGMAPGTSIAIGQSVVPIMHLISFLIPRDDCTAMINFGEGPLPFEDTGPAGTPLAEAARPPAPAAPAERGKAVDLQKLAFTRSGEKGETVNIGIIARKPEHLPYLRAALTTQAVIAWLSHLFTDPDQAEAEIFDLPGISGFNIVLKGALPGGINDSKRLDSAAKSVGQQLVDFPVPYMA